jgi:hypothetical protein
VGGFPNEPAFSIADWVRQFILAAPFAWRWNRSFGAITTAPGVQDYTLANYLIASNDFTNAAWIPGGSPPPTITAGAGIAPNGASANSISFPGTGPTQFNQITQTVSSSFPFNGESFTFSVWMKTVTGTANIAVTLQTTPFDPLGPPPPPQAFSITAAVTTSWQRFSVTGAFPFVFPSSVQLGVALQLASNQPTSLVLVWGAQLEPNGAVGTFIPTTTAPITFFSNLGFLEKASISDGTNQKELQIALNLAQDSTPNRPISISPYIDNAGGVTMRLLPVPDKIYTVNVDFQNAAPTFQNLTDTWAPIPDYYYYMIETGFLAKTYEYNNDERFAPTMQMFVKQVVAASAGMADTQKNLYMDEFVNANREMQSEIGNSQSGRQARGLF